MLYTDKFIQEHYNKYQLMKYLEGRLERAGLASVDIQRTPVITRITLEVLNPARIIGRRGKLINDLTTEIKKKFGIDNPQISVLEIKDPFLEPKIVARRAAKNIEMGKKVRAVLHQLMREIFSHGAIGAEIVASGKIGAKGARAKKLRMSAGFIPKSGEPARLVKVAHLSANTRSGVIGVLVRIVPPGTVFPDQVNPHAKKESVESAVQPEKPKQPEAQEKAAEAVPEPKKDVTHEEVKPAPADPKQKAAKPAGSKSGKKSAGAKKDDAATSTPSAPDAATASKPKGE